MLFRNAMLFRFPKSAAADLAESLEAQLGTKVLRPCGKLEMATRGWVSPYGRGHGRLVAGVGAFRLLALGGEDKLLPPAVVDAAVAERIEALEAERGRPVGGRERRRLKEEVTEALVPQAFVRPSRLAGYLDLADGWLVVDTASRKAAEGFLTVLRDSLDGFPAVPPEPGESPRALLTEWLTGSKLPQGIELGDECELRDPADQGAIVRCRRQDLEADEVREHLKSGKLVAQLGLVVDGRVSLVLGEDLVLRKLRFLDAAVESIEGDRHDGAEAEIDARFAVTTLTLKPLLSRLAEWFGLARPRERRA
jgi:recombination associated protein RdgC